MGTFRSGLNSPVNGILPRASTISTHSTADVYSRANQDRTPTVFEFSFQVGVSKSETFFGWLVCFRGQGQRATRFGFLPSICTGLNHQGKSKEWLENEPFCDIAVATLTTTCLLSAGSKESGCRSKAGKPISSESPSCRAASYPPPATPHGAHKLREDLMGHHGLCELVTDGQGKKKARLRMCPAVVEMSQI